jgi:DMSO/TMAO reductase YedYZ heme-binding membrane subunit
MIGYLQTTLVGGSVLYLMSMPTVLAYYPSLLPPNIITTLFLISLLSVTFVMSIRPLADILMGVKFIRPLVILRKGFGVLSASIIVGFILSKMLVYGFSAYIANIGTPTYWSLDRYALFAHLGDLSAIILLITSNNFSKRMLGFWWKRIQKLAYVYFYAGATYEWLAFNSTVALGAIILVTILVVTAWRFNARRRAVAAAAPRIATPTPPTDQATHLTIRA